MKLRNMILILCLLLCLTIPVEAEETPAYITLSEDTTLSLNGECVTIDLAGYDLTVTGQGSILLTDSSNDTYDAAACGSLVCSEAVQVAPQATAPNGNRYVTIKKDGAFSAHRLELELTHVTLRTAGAGLYYRATYHCDAAVEAAVTGYGVVLSLQDMPGADFKTENHNAWTALETGFASGVSVTSGAVVNILSDRCTAEQNGDRSSRSTPPRQQRTSAVCLGLSAAPRTAHSLTSISKPSADISRSRKSLSSTPGETSRVEKPV